ncbi:polyketide cyclase / dehydrase and lipid transport [Rhodococcus aerolatus]
MASVDVADETFLAVAPEQVAAAVARPERWRRWWPDLQLTVHHDRGPEGLRWRVTGALTGSAEVWLEPVLDGTVLHYFLRGELDASPAAAAAETHRRRVTGKQVARELKRELEAGRAPGEPPDRR